MSTTASPPVTSQWFDIAEVADGVLRITEPHVHPYVRSNAFLVRGATAHVLVDSGLGIAGLSAGLSRWLDRPVIAVATHAHFDHFGSLDEFTDRAAHPSDGPVIEAASDYVTLSADTLPGALAEEFTAASHAVPDLLIDAVPGADFDVRAFRTRPASITRWLSDGDVLHTGDRSLEVLHTPGHTPGSICLWEAGTGMLFSGDVLVDGEALQDDLPRSDKADYAASLRRLAGLPLTAVFGGHGPVFGPGRAHEIIAGYLGRRADGKLEQ